MLKSSSPSRENKAPPGAIARLVNHWREFGDRLFASDDQTARGRGWEIQRRHGGMARRYRDPRFSWLSSCPWCHGSGGDGQQACPACRGTGRIRRPQPPTLPGGERDDHESLAQAQ